MDVDAPGVPGPDEDPPDFDTWTDPDDLLADRPIRERMLDVALQLREPATVAAVAERVDCDPETARDYLGWLDRVGVLVEHPGRPVRYEVNGSYLRWRRVEAIRGSYTDEELDAELSAALAELREHRERFGADHPDEVSLFEAARDRDDPPETVWEKLSEWKTTRRRAALLDAARREDHAGPASDEVDG